MARRIELRTGVLLANGANGAPVTFSWGEMMQNVLRHAPPQQGLVLDQILRSVEAMGPITKAIDDQAESVTLTEEQYRTLKERLDNFPFAVADPAIAEFGLAVRNAPEIT
jgi:hypothetical protein